MPKGKKQMTTIRVERATVEYLTEIKHMLGLRGQKDMTLEEVILEAAQQAFGDDLAKAKKAVRGKDQN